MASKVSFSRVLIANRGEIARRIQASCRRLGLETVAVFSEADRDALFVAEADFAVCIGPATPSESYLKIEAVLAAAHATNAGAIHPGYGFLSENPEFAHAVEAAGLTYVGPTPDAISTMGSKITAKAAAEDAGVPTLPGYRGEDQSDSALLEAAEKLGVPFLVKASAGGGGRGMRLVTDMDDAAQAIASARTEAKGAFGDDTVFLERYLARARHIEVQVLGDTHGNHLHLWDRDCSLQRNHQKLIEEAPAPNLPDAPRQVMLDAAVGLARAINYRSAGTVEYLYDPADHAVYFLEMNTRIQVEHPVTEAITGIDLIDWQLRIAQGAALSMTQDQIPCTGHAIEVRVSAENPAEGFLPQTGTLSLWQPPQGPGLRLDSGVGQGSEVSHHYDSMIAKLIAHAPDRQSAIQRAVKGIDDFATGGVGLNLTYQRALLCHPDFGAVTHFTSGLDAMFPGGWAAPVADPTTRALAVLALHLYLSQTGQGAGPWQSLGAWRLTDKGSASYWDDAGGKVFVAGQGPDFAITDGDADAIVIQTAGLQGPRLSVTLNDAPVQRLVHFERRGGQWCVYVNLSLIHI
ncbi:MAG: ATP-grasp domain-containing protein [Marinosulfonomonas sp.]|nr:ATP-grasp domain-containing protein [Marinosulfonomonas sp.]